MAALKNDKSGDLQILLLQRQQMKERRTSFSHSFTSRTPAMELNIQAQVNSGNQRRRRTSLSPQMRLEGGTRRRRPPSKVMEGGVGGVPKRRRTSPMPLMTRTTNSLLMENAAQKPHQKTSLNPVFNKPLRTPRKKGIRWNKIFDRVHNKHKHSSSGPNNTPEGSATSSGGGSPTPSNREDVESIPITSTTRSSGDASTTKGPSKSDSEVLGQVTDILGFYGLDDLVNVGKISTTPSSGQSTNRNSENQEATRKEEESTGRKDTEEKSSRRESDKERPKTTRSSDDGERRSTKRSDEEEDPPRKTTESGDSEDSPKKTTKKKSSKDDEEDDEEGDDEEPPKKKSTKSSKDEEERKKVDGKMDFIILLFKIIIYLCILLISLKSSNVEMQNHF